MFETPMLQGYIHGFFKEAWDLPGAGAAGAAAEAATGLSEQALDILSRFILPTAIMAPALMGLASGSLHSKLTSPSKLDQEGVQKALLAAELEEFAATMKRRRELALRKEKERKAEMRAPPRSIHGM